MSAVECIVSAHFREPDAPPESRCSPEATIEERAILDTPQEWATIRGQWFGRVHPYYPWLRCVSVTARVASEEDIRPDFIRGDA